MIDFDMLYNRLNSPSLLPWIESISLVERASGRASTLSVSLCNADGRFLSSWRATKGDSISIHIKPATADIYSIKNISVNRSPAVVTWEAEGRPVTTKSPSNRGGGLPPPSGGAFIDEKKSWDSAVTGKRLKFIAQKVCEECGLTLKYVAKSNPVFSYVARTNETGFHLLNRLCRRYSLVFRANAGSITITSFTSKNDASPPSDFSIRAKSITNLSSSETLEALRVQSARLDPRSAMPVKYSGGDGDGQTLDLEYDAVDAFSIYSSAISEAKTAVVDIVPQAGLAPGCLVQIDGLGLREVIEMRYNRSGDGETMSLTVKGV